MIIIGGGAAGMIASIRAAERGRRTLLIEKSERIGRKILAAGNGRCNLMNSGETRYYGDAEFAGQVMAKAPREALTAFFARYGLVVTEEDEGRIYPVTFMSATVMNVLKAGMALNGVHVKTNTAADGVRPCGDGFETMTRGGEKLRSGKVMIACGGAAQPKLGGSADGYRILESLGHRLIPIAPALVPLTTDKKSVSGLAGLRVRCGVTVLQDGTEVHRERGEVLFTEYGVSGICVMQCARFAREENTTLSLNLMEHIFPDRESALREMERRRALFAEKSPAMLMNGMMAEKLGYAVLKQAGIPMRGETAAQISDAQLEAIIRTAYGYQLQVQGNRGFDFAQVTSGGIDCREFAPENMESRLVRGIHAAGEVLNVDGDCGGFNLMFAFSSGLNAGNAL